MIRSFGGLDEKRTVQAEGDFAIFLLTMQLIISLFFHSGGLSNSEYSSSTKY